MKRLLLMAGVIALAGLLAACGGNANGKSKNEVTIGYFPNMTHITTIVGLENGYFEETFGDVKVKTKTFTQGGLFMEALATKAIDIGTTGPGPVLNHYAKTPDYRIISGAANGGAILVASKDSGIHKVKDFDGKRVAIPGLGNTQDLMLRKELESAGLKAKTNGGTVDLHPSAPADMPTLFRQHSVAAAAVPEPWGYVLEKQGGKVIADWEDFAWGRDTPVTVVATSASYLKDHADRTNAFLEAHEKAIQFIQENPEEAKKRVSKHIQELTGKELAADELDAAFGRLVITNKVNQKVVQEMADISKSAKYISDSDIKGMIDLSLLQK